MLGTILHTYLLYKRVLTIWQEKKKKNKIRKGFQTLILEFQRKLRRTTTKAPAEVLISWDKSELYIVKLRMCACSVFSSGPTKCITFTDSSILSF